MTKLNLTECCIMEASGELGDKASTRLHRYLSMHPRAQREFDAIKSQLDAVRSLPHVELSAAERIAFSARLKTAIHAKLAAQQRAELARRRWKLVSYFTVGVAAAAAVVALIGGIMAIDRSSLQNSEQEKIAQIDRATDRLAPYGDQPNQYDQEITNMQASITQLKTEGPTLVAGVDNREMVSVLNVLATVPTDDPDTDTR
jgi:hypothetical protein